MVLTSISYLFAMITLVCTQDFVLQLAIHLDVLVQGFSVLRICTTWSPIIIVIVSAIVL